MNNPKSVFILFASFLILTFEPVLQCAASGAEVPLEVMNLQRVVDLAIEKDATIKIAQNKKEESQAKRRQAASSLFPSISISSSALEKKDALASPVALFGGEPYNFYDVSLQLTQPIYRGGLFSNTLSLLNKENSAKEVELEIAERDLITKSVQTYYLVLLTRKKIETLEKIETVNREVLKTAQRKAAVGVGKNLAVLQAKTQLALLKPRITEALLELQVKATILADLIGETSRDKISVKGELTVLNVASLIEERKRQKTRRPELEKIQIAIEQSENKRGMEMAKHLPQLNFVANAGRSATKSADLSQEDRTTWYFGAQLTIPIFTGLSSVYERQVLAAQTQTLEYEKSKLQKDLALEQIQAEKELEAAMELIDGSQIARDLATEALKEAQRLYNAGTTTFLELTLAQRDLVDSELALDQSKYGLITKTLRYYTANGWPVAEVVRVLSK